MLVRNNFLLVSGTGRNTGKTLLATKVIEKFAHLGVTAIKVSPHFHSLQQQPLLLGIPKFIEVYEESNPNGHKDSSRMLGAGASKVIYVQCHDHALERVLNIMIRLLDPETPIICESGALSRYLTPGIHVMMTPFSSNSMINNPSICFGKKRVAGSPHVRLNLLNFHKIFEKLQFTNGRWTI